MQAAQVVNQTRTQILEAGALIASGIGRLVAIWSRIKATKLIR